MHFLVKYTGSLSCIPGCPDCGSKPIKEKVLDIYLVHLKEKLLHSGVPSGCDRLGLQQPTVVTAVEVQPHRRLMKRVP